MSSASGANRYYSPNNPLANNMHYEYLPDAQGFAFAVTEYTPDNTGRVRRQGGVGQTHQLNSGHETKYYYSTPTQEELDRLFGNNVGYHKHYEKRMVIDPNGQASVSYVDLSGNVIATALAGDVPSNLEALPSAGNPIQITSEIKSDEVDAVPTAASLHSLNLYKSITIPQDAESHTFSYSIDIPTFTDAEVSGLCFDCVYELEISLKDECLAEQFDGDPATPGNQPIVRVLGKLSANYDVNCDGPLTYSFVTDQDLSSQNITVQLNTGSYFLSKTLRISQAAMEYYAEEYIKNNAQLKTKQEFIDEYLAEVDYDDCDFDCETCDELYSTAQDSLDFEAEKVQEMAANGLTATLEDKEAIGFMFHQLKMDCETMCSGGVTKCASFLEMMKADMRPGGQYAGFDFDQQTGTFTGYGMFDKTEGENVLGFTYQYEAGMAFSAIDYSDGGKYNDLVEIDGILKSPQELTAEEFVANFKEEWVEVLVKLHPEYCHYEFCKDETESEEYDRDLLATTTYREAWEKGYLNPLSMSGTKVPVPLPPVAGKDPFFETGATGAGLKQDLEDKLRNYRNPDDMDQNCRLFSAWKLQCQFMHALI
jgi:hypothetical protein